MTSLTSKTSQEERLPVLVSGEHGIKLLGVPALQVHNTEKAGESISSASLELLNKWDCADCIRTMVFDTTSVNTGHISAACIAIQEKLQRPLLWCACRHHVGEVVLTHIWEDLNIEISRSPEITIFNRLRNNFDKLTVNDPGGYSYALKDECTLSIVEMANEILKSSLEMRGDYKEVLQLVVMYIDGGETIFQIQKPGAVNKARWMSKILYCLKLALLENKIVEELPKGTVFASGQREKITRFVDFVIRVYVRWWYTAIFPEEAARSDLQLSRSLQHYRDKIISASAIQAFSNHTWYLTEELVPLALFSRDLSVTEKDGIAQKLLSLQSKEEPLFNRYGSGFGKPHFPSVDATSQLSSFIGKSSWQFFRILNISTDFLQLPSSEWQTAPSFLDGLATVRNIRVVNDSAERGVKLSSDFLSTAQIEKRYQNVLQVVENDRGKIPDQRKRKGPPRAWFLQLDK